jgi:hypothetical protein
MRRWILALAPLSLALPGSSFGCSSTASSGNETQSLGDGDGDGDGSGDGDGDGDGSGDGDGDGDGTGDGDGDGDGGPRYDLWIPDTEDEPPPPEMTCENIGDFPKTSTGCEFYGVDLPMYASQLPYGISVGNPSNAVANIVIEDMRGPGDTLREVTAFQLDPEDSLLVKINGTDGILAGEQHDILPVGDNPRAAFRVTSDVPVTAMQINPVGGGDSAIAEASMLLPKKGYL